MSKASPILLLILIVYGLSAKAEIFSAFNPERQDRFACQISSHLNDYLKTNKTTFRSELAKIQTHLKTEIATWASVLSFDQPLIGTSKFLFADYDYFQQNAFVDQGNIDLSKLEDKNWFGAYAFLSAKYETRFRLGEIPKYQLSTNDNLREEIRSILPLTENLRWPSYLDENGQTKRALFNCRASSKYGEICGSADTTPPGNPDHPQYQKWIEVAQGTNLIASPLFEWILSQPNNSISYEKLFDRAMTQFKNPFVALGVITWMMMVDADMGHRSRGALISKRLQPILYASDQPGLNYHFWGFLLKSLNGEGFKYRVMSFVHERIIQGDQADWLVDDLSISFGHKILSRLKDPNLCAQ